MSKRESKNILIITVIVAAIAVIGSTVYNGMSFKGTGMAGQTKANWKIDITNIGICTMKDQVNDARCQSIQGEGANVDDSTYISDVNSLKAFFTAELHEFGDAVTYKVEITNSGSLDARLTDIKFNNLKNNPVIFTYNNLAENEIIEAQSSKVFYVMASYIGDASSNDVIFTNTLELNFTVAE